MAVIAGVLNTIDHWIDDVDDEGVPWRSRGKPPPGNGLVDEAGRESFPASDAPAHRYVDIPVNRRDTTH